MAELYRDDLLTLRALLGRVESVANEDNVVDVEIRVKLFESDTWIVLGYGESGDPCVLRFEELEKILPIQPKAPLWTINNKLADVPKPNVAEKRCRCGDFALFRGSCGPNGCYNCPA